MRGRHDNGADVDVVDGCVVAADLGVETPSLTPISRRPSKSFISPSTVP